MLVKNAIAHQRFFKNEEHSDVEFIVQKRNGDSVRLPAHRFILMTRSPVFERMFFGGLKEGSTVTITDVCAEAFEEFLQFFYLAEVNLTSDNLSEVLKLIDKYDASEFWPQCETFMQQTLTEPMAFHYHELALSFRLSDAIKAKSEAIVCKNPKEVFESAPGGSSLMVLVDILRSDKLIGKETDIFAGVMAWAEASLRQQNRAITVENIAQELGECLQLIRFPVMASKELLQCFSEYPVLLPPDQWADLLNYAATKKALTVAGHFSCKKRLDQYHEYKIPLFVEQISQNATCHSKPSCLILQWAHDYAMQYLVSFKGLIQSFYNRGYGREHITIDKCTVTVKQNNMQVFSQSVPLESCDRGCRCLLELKDPIGFSKSYDTVEISIALPCMVYLYDQRSIAPTGSMPDGLSIIISSSESFVSEIRLKEIP